LEPITSIFRRTIIKGRRPSPSVLVRQLVNQPAATIVAKIACEIAERIYKVRIVETRHFEGPLSPVLGIYA